MVISMLSASNTVRRQFVGCCTPARMSLDGGQFTFLGQSVTLTERYQIVKLHGPWMAEKVRHSFRRGFVKLPDGITEHDETAAHMLMRIEKSAAKAEVCASPTLGLASALSGHHDLSTTILVCAQEQRVKLHEQVAAMDAEFDQHGRASRQSSSAGPSVGATSGSLTGSSRKLSPSSAVRPPPPKRAYRRGPSTSLPAATVMPPSRPPLPNPWNRRSCRPSEQSEASVSVLDVHGYPPLATALQRVTLGASHPSNISTPSRRSFATPSKPTHAAAAADIAHSSPHTDLQPLTKRTSAAATAAALEVHLQPVPLPPPVKRFTRSQGRASTDAAAAAELRAQQAKERERRTAAQAQMRGHLTSLLHGAGANIHETLKMEWVLQEECTGSERQMGMAFTALLKQARLNFDHLPESRGWGVYELGALQRVLRGDPTLQATVVTPSIAGWKDAQAQVLSGLAPFEAVVARPDETLIAFMTRCQEELMALSECIQNV